MHERIGLGPFPKFAAPIPEDGLPRDGSLPGGREMLPAARPVRHGVRYIDGMVRIVRLSEPGVVFDATAGAAKETSSPGLEFYHAITILRMNATGGRAEKGLSQNELAKASGLSKDEIQQIETRLKNPRPATIAKICDGVGMDEHDPRRDMLLLTAARTQIALARGEQPPLLAQDLLIAAQEPFENPPPQLDIQDTLIALRNEAGFDQAQMAELVFRTKDYYEKIELAHRNPSPELLAAICDVTGRQDMLDDLLLSNARTQISHAQKPVVRFVDGVIQVVSTVAEVSEEPGAVIVIYQATGDQTGEKAKQQVELHDAVHILRTETKHGDGKVGFSQDLLAKNAGLARNAITYVENGQRDATPEMIARLCDGLKMHKYDPRRDMLLLAAAHIQIAKAQHKPRPVLPVEVLTEPQIPLPKKKREPGIGQQLLSLREKAGLSRRELADACHISFRLIESIELSQRSAYPEYIAAICDATKAQDMLDKLLLVAAYERISSERTRRAARK